MLFGLAGLVGYAIVDPFASTAEGAHSNEVSGQNDDAVETGTDLIDGLDDTSADGDVEGVADSAADGAEITNESADGNANGEPDEGAVENTDGDTGESGDTIESALDATDETTDDATDETEDTDVAAAEQADVSIDGTTDDDLIYGGDGDYIINGGDGDDQLHGGDGNTTINGDDGDDRLFAGDGFIGISANTLNGGAGDDTLYGSNEAVNTLDGGDGDDDIHILGQDIATGGTGADAFHYATEYSNGMQSMITDYDAAEDQIIVEHTAGFISGGEIPAPEVSITLSGNDAVICLDGDECIVAQGAANSLRVEDILLRATPLI